MRVLVTGGAGYIGSHVMRELALHGHDPVAYDNLSTGHACLVRNFELIVGDVGDRNRLAPALRSVDAVMHFAASAYVGESVYNPRKYFDNNVNRGLCLVDTAIDCGVKLFVLSSTCAVYGIPERTPIMEEMPCRPVNPYGISKLVIEEVLSSYEQAYGLKSARLRYFNAAGADELGETGEMHEPETHLIPLVLAAAAGDREAVSVFGEDYPTEDGTCIRDYIHVNDLADAHVRALRRLETEKESFTVNLGSGEGCSVRQIISKVEEVTRRNVPVRTESRRLGDPPILVADTRKADRLLGWRAHRGLEQIVATAWEWYRCHKGN